MESSRAVLASGAAQGARWAACEAGMSAAVAPDLLGFHCGPMFAAGLPIRREAEGAEFQSVSLNLLRRTPLFPNKR